MPTYLRLIIMLGETIGFLIFSLFRCRVYYKAYLEDKEKNLFDLRVSIVYYSICYSIILFIFLFSFPSYIFLSYSKLVLLTIAVIYPLIPFSLFTGEFYDKHPAIAFIIFLIFLSGGVTSVVGTVFSFCAPEELMQFKICINEENHAETIYPEINLTDKSKVGYSLDSSGKIDSYLFFYQDDDIWYKVDEFIEDTTELPEDKTTYVEKYVSKKDIKNLELDESDDNFITTEETVTYKLYYNTDELIQITD